jgi:hypothetical protein
MSPMTPEAAVSRFGEIIRSSPALSEEQLYAAMMADGIPLELADRVFKFTQVAWGRALLADLGIKFAPDYCCLDASGEILESGFLAQNPCFVAASKIAAQYSDCEGFRFLAVSSAEFNAISSAMNDGSDPRNLVTGRIVMFVEAPTGTGAQRAKGLAVPESEPSERAPVKAWWQFWK